MTGWEDFIYFFSFSDQNINNVLIGTALLGIVGGLVGSLVVLSKRTLVIDAISHSMLPGIALGFLISGIKDPLYLLLGGMTTSALSVLMINAFVNRSKIKPDAAIAITLSVLFSIGVILLNLVQNTGNPNQSGLNDFLFGKAASMLSSDLKYFAILNLFALTIIPIFYRQFKIGIFDPIFGHTIGIQRNFVQFLISLLTILTAAAGIQTVGIILMSAIIIAPASAALFWTRNFSKVMMIAAGIGISCSIAGVYISYLFPEMPTGPWVVVVLATLSLFSVLLSPRGLIAKQLQIALNRKKIKIENCLKSLYKVQFNEKRILESVTAEELAHHLFLPSSKLEKTLKKLKRKHWVIHIGNSYCLTDKGKIEAERIIRIHRLWELYLEKYMALPPHLVHDSAESIEHVITPELERALTKIMGKPIFDPHQQKIPYHD